MKTIIPLFALLLFSIHVNAQDCRAIKRTLEPSTGKIIWEAPIEEHVYLVKSYHPDLKDTFYVATFFVSSVVAGESGKGVSITLDNGAVLKFPQSEVTTHTNGSRAMHESYTDLSLDQLRLLAKSTIKSLKLDGYGADLPKTESQHLSGYAQCLLLSK